MKETITTTTMNKAETQKIKAAAKQYRAKLTKLGWPEIRIDAAVAVMFPSIK